MHFCRNRVSVGNAAPRHGFETVGESDRLRPVVRLEISDHHIPPGLRGRAPPLQHAVVLADAGAHPEEDLVTAAALAHGISSDEFTTSPPSSAGRAGLLRQ